ncbi:MAG: hypothetical protein E6J85_02615 [Deltaproteobacteria bacterium]|nr:MAG: hypothetical protein E6J85_02615 [Deltaproteobacteria bacterium]
MLRTVPASARTPASSVSTACIAVRSEAASCRAIASADSRPRVLLRAGLREARLERLGVGTRAQQGGVGGRSALLESPGAALGHLPAQVAGLESRLEDVAGGFHRLEIGAQLVELVARVVALGARLEQLGGEPGGALLQLGLIGERAAGRILLRVHGPRGRGEAILRGGERRGRLGT